MIGWLRRLFGFGDQPTRKDSQAPAIVQPQLPPALGTIIALPRRWATSAPPGRYCQDGSEIVVFDCETTGFGRGHRIVALAALRLNTSLRPVGGTYLVFNPERRSDPRAYEVHGLDDDYLARQSLFRDFAKEIREVFDDAGACSHNLQFDLPMLNSELRRAGVRPVGQRSANYCTMLECRARLPSVRSGLDSICAHIGLQRSGEAHGALEDAALAAQVLRWLNHLHPHHMVTLGAPANER